MTRTKKAEPKLTSDGRDPRTEAWLDEMAVPWTFEPEVFLSAIDVDGGLRNQARVAEPLDGDTVERYVAAMREGAVFPPCLLRKRGRKRHLPLGGNHRIAAAKTAGRDAVSGYLVEVTDESATALMYGDNIRHGLPPSRAERIQMAVHLHEACGYNQRSAAAAVGLGQPAVSLALKDRESTRRAEDLEVGASFRALPQAARNRLAPLRSDPVFAEAVELVAGTRMPADDVVDLAKRLQDARSDKEALRIVGIERDERIAAMQEVAAKGGQERQRAGPSAFLVARRAATAFVGVRPAEVADTALSAEAVASLRELLTEVGKQAMAMDAALAKVRR